MVKSARTERENLPFLIFILILVKIRIILFNMHMHDALPHFVRHGVQEPGYGPGWDGSRHFQHYICTAKNCLSANI